MEPPLQPSSPSSQSTSSCSDNETRFPFLIAQRPSMEPVVEKAQHDPQPPWFLTGVTLPCATQSMLDATSGRMPSTTIRRPFRSFVLARFNLALAWKSSAQTFPTTLSLNSFGVISAKGVSPMVHEWPSWLCRVIVSTLSLKISKRLLCSSALRISGSQRIPFLCHSFHIPQYDSSVWVRSAAKAALRKSESMVNKKVRKG